MKTIPSFFRGLSQFAFAGFLTTAFGQTVAPPPATASAASDKPLQLSPFQVTTSRDTGYAAENTTAGSRLATPISDLAASITVITKQQMTDTASLDINDVFKYEASTEGSSTFAPSIVDRGTVKDTLAGYSFATTATRPRTRSRTGSAG